MIKKRRFYALLLLCAGFAVTVFAYEHRHGITQKTRSVLVTLKAQIKADTLQILPDFVYQNSIKVADASLDEASGIAASFANPGCFYTHNDSGNENLVYLIGPDGKDRAVFKLNDYANIDWEDIACGPGPAAGKKYVYVADIGDNSFSRPSVFVYRFWDRKTGAGKSPVKEATGADRLEIKYPDGAHNAETLMIDPATRNIYIVTKEKKQGGVYVIRYPQKTGAVNTAEKLGTVPVDRATGGSISPDGKHILVKDYLNIYSWKKGDKMSIMQAMEQPRLRVAYRGEMQGEAVGWLSDGKGYATISESPLKQPVSIFLYRQSTSATKK